MWVPFCGVPKLLVSACLLVSLHVGSLAGFLLVSPGLLWYPFMWVPLPGSWAPCLPLSPFMWFPWSGSWAPCFALSGFFLPGSWALMSPSYGFLSPGSCAPRLPLPPPLSPFVSLYDWGSGALVPFCLASRGFFLSFGASCLPWSRFCLPSCRFLCRVPGFLVSLCLLLSPFMRVPLPQCPLRRVSLHVGSVSWVSGLLVFPCLPACGFESLTAIFYISCSHLLSLQAAIEPHLNLWSTHATHLKQGA